MMRKLSKYLKKNKSQRKKQMTAKKPVVVNKETQLKPSLRQALEPRLMFDAAAVVEVIAANSDAEAQEQAANEAVTQDQQKSDTEAQAQALFNDQENSDSTTTTPTPVNEIVFIDTTVDDYETIANSLTSNINIVYIESGTDGIATIANTLSSYQGLDSIHIITHGSQGQLNLGSSLLNSNTLDDYQTELAVWANALSDTGDVLLYGCDVAEGEAGQLFIDSLSDVLNADIAASIDATGDADLGGDWILEAISVEEGGAMTSLSIVNDALIANYDYVLEVANATNPDVVPTTYEAGTNEVNVDNDIIVSDVIIDLDRNNPATDHYWSGAKLQVQITSGADANDQLNFSTDGLYLDYNFYGGEGSVELTNYPGKTFEGDLYYEQNFHHIGFANISDNGGELPAYISGSNVLEFTFNQTDNTNYYETGAYIDHEGSYAKQFVTSADVARLMNLVKFSTSADASLGTRTITFTLLDSNNNVIDIVTSDVDVIAEQNSAPDLIQNNTVLTTIEPSIDPATNTGTIVSDLVSATDSNGDSIGIAVSDTYSEFGTWEYSTDSGSTWNTIPDGEGIDAFLLSADDVIRFSPDGTHAESASLTFYAWDSTDGTANTTITLPVTGGDSAYSLDSDSVSINVGTSPEITPANQFLDTINTNITDESNTGSLVSDLLVNSNAYDAASDPLGMAVYDVYSDYGTWEYSSDNGGTWNSIPDGDYSNAFLLDANDYIRFNPDGNNSESPNLTFYAWDGTDGETVHTSVSLISTGGNTAFSSVTDTIYITVEATLNSAPELISNYANMTTIEPIMDDPSNTGSLVADLIDATDSDGDSIGMAAINLFAQYGTWEYSTDSGSTWNLIPDGEGVDAFLLAPTDYIRFNPGSTDAEIPSLEFYAWDGTDGTVNTTITLPPTGGDSAYSEWTDTVYIAVGTAPAISSSDQVVLDTIDPQISGAANTGTLVSTILTNAGAYDAAGDTLGMAVYNTNASFGSWEYSDDSGVNWYSIPDEEYSNFFLLDANDLIRFSPDGISEESASIEFYAWDGSTDSESVHSSIPYASIGGNTAYSNNTGTATITVEEINATAPSITAGSSINYSEQDSPTVIDSTIIISDTESNWDNGTLTVQITLNNESTDTLLISEVNNVTLSGDDIYVSGIMIATYDSASSVTNDGILTISFNANATDNDVQEVARAIAYSNSSDNPSTLERTVTFTTTDGSALSASATATISVTAVNDAPTASDNTISINEDSTYTFIADDFNFSDIDGDSLQSIQITSLPSNGTLEYNSFDVTLDQVISVTDINSGLLQFIPANNASGSDYDSFGFTVNDGTTDSSSEYSVSINVSAVNDAPAISGSVELASFNEDTSDPSGVSITSFLSGLTWTEGESGEAQGVAITSVDNTNGTWEYSTDTGSNWNSITATSDSNALLLSSSSANMIRFVPDADYHGNSGDITVRAWDQSSDSSGDSVDVSTNGGSTAFSSDTATGYFTINAVPDTPSIASITTNEDTQSGLIIVTSPTEATDISHYKVTGISGGSLFLADGTTAVSNGDFVTKAQAETGFTFTPTANSTSDGSFSVQSSASANDAGLGGDVVSATISVTAVNDAPTASDNTISINEDSTYTFIADDFNFSDIDGDSLQSIQITSQQIMPVVLTMTALDLQ